MSEALAARLADAIQALVRTSATVPAPRGLPYLRLESASGTGAHLLDALSARGIFRKYELVLDLATGLGDTARWVAARLGCEVVALAHDGAAALAAAELTRRAGLAAQVCTLAAAPGTLPLREGRFTHVWIVEALASLPDPATTLAAACRAVRPGGMLAVQELVVGEGAPSVAGLRFLSERDLLTAVDAAGFVERQVRDRSAEAAERAARITAARAQLLARLRTDRALATVAATREALAAALGSSALRVLQVLARRP